MFQINFEPRLEEMAEQIESVLFFRHFLQTFQRIHEVMNQMPEKPKECPVCMDEEDELLLLPCRHYYGRNCLKQTLIQAIEQRGMAKVPCVPECEYMICPDDFFQYADEQEKMMIQDKLFSLNVIEGLKENEIFTNCMNRRCLAKVVIWKEADFFTCPKCSTKQCAKCHRKYHEPSVTCSMAYLKSLSEEDLKILQDLIKKGMKMCPHCMRLVEKTKGCNFITCISDICKGENYFCWLCAQKLQKAEEFSHYANENPYSKKCFGLGVQEQTVKPLENNRQPCPKCKTVDPKICEIDSNLGGLVCHCKNCKTHLCLTCHREIQINQLDNHFKIDTDGIKCDPKQCIIF